MKTLNPLPPPRGPDQRKSALLDEIKIPLNRTDGHMELPGQLRSSYVTDRTQPIDDANKPKEFFVIGAVFHTPL